MRNDPKIFFPGGYHEMKWGVVFFVTPFFFYISRNCIFILFSSHYPPEMGDFLWCCEVKRKQTKVLVLDIFLASPSTIDMHSQLAAFRTQRSRKNISWGPLGATIFLTTLKDTLEKRSDRDPESEGPISRHVVPRIFEFSWTLNCSQFCWSVSHTFIGWKRATW